MRRMDENGKKPGVLKKALGFVLGKGFYLALFLCVCAIGVSGYVIFAGAGGSEIELPELPEDIGLVTGVSYSGFGQSTTEPPSTEPTENIAGATSATEALPAAGTQPPEQTDKSTTKKPVKVFYVRPLAGRETAVFSGETPVYNPTMDDWRVHSGLDIAAAEGEPVCAVAAGAVSAVYTDYFKGICVEITHLDGLVSAYCGLADSVTVEPGDTVTAGSVIGAVGVTGIFEALEEPHLHFELREQGRCIDPMLRLPEAAN